MILLGAGSTGLVLGVSVGLPFARRKIAEFVDGSDGAFGAVEGEPTAWFEVTPENVVRVYLPKVEMGQGVHTALTQIAVEELEVAWDQVETHEAGTGQGLDDSVGTSGSSTVASLYTPLREAGALMRLMLLEEAARLLGTSVDGLQVEEGRIFLSSDSTKSLTYGEIVQNVEEWKLPDEVPALKEIGSYRYIGKSLPRVDLVDKVTGKAVYGYDMRLPGMLFGAVARPPQVGARLTDASEGSAGKMPGVVKVVLDDGFAGVVAQTRLQARNAVGNLDLQWEAGKNFQQSDIDRMVKVGNGKEVIIQKEGNPASVFRSGQYVESEYRTPMAFHAHLEPQAAIVDVRSDRVDVWVSNSGSGACT